CPADVTIECDEDTLPANTGSATATDLCDMDVTPTYADVTAAGDCDQEYVITRTWTAVDDCGNANTCTQVITIVDTTAPVCLIEDFALDTAIDPIAGVITVLPEWFHAGSYDNCGEVSLT